MNMQNDEQTWVITPRASGFISYITEMFKYMRLMKFLAWKIMQKQYQRSFLGRLWLLIRPAMVVVMYSVLFGLILQVESDPIPYIVFIVLGFAIWNVFDRGLTWGTRCIDAVRGLLTKIYFPRMLLPIAGQATAVVELGVYAIYLAGTAAFYNGYKAMQVFSLEPKMAAALVAIVLAFYLAIALSLFTSILDAKGRDMRFGLRYVTQVWMFLTPVVYPIERLPEFMRGIIEWNPMTPIVQAFRASLLTGGVVDWQSLVYPLIVATVLSIGGVLFFIDFEGRTSDSL